MSTRAIILIGLLAAGAFVIWGGRSSATERKRITIEVASPQGKVSGSSVIEVVTARAPIWYPTGTGNRTGSAYRGEAPFVDLGNGRYLFVTLNNQLREKPITAFLQPDRMEADGTFKPGWVPMLVTFADVGDASTIRKVEPDELGDQFGAGHRLLRLVVTETDDPPTVGILAARFPALHSQLSIPPAKRSGLSDTRRGDLRKIGWDAFEG